MTGNFKNFLALIAAFVLLSCNSSKDPNDEGLSDPEVLYSQGLSSLHQDQYEEAAKKFELLEREHPASLLASKAQMQRAYAQYLSGKFDDAIIIIDDFIRQYPASPNVSYMYYLKGLCYYEQIVDIGRDQVLTTKSIEAFQGLINRFPETHYAKDAKLKIEYAFNLLAGKEMEIGRFYLNQTEFLAALNRFKTVITEYQTSIFVPESLYRMTEIYYVLGDVNEAQIYASVLGYNYPDSEWYKKAYKLIAEGKSEIKLPWYSRITKIW